MNEHTGTLQAGGRWHGPGGRAPGASGCAAIALLQRQEANHIVVMHGMHYVISLSAH